MSRVLTLTITCDRCPQSEEVIVDPVATIAGAGISTQHKWHKGVGGDDLCESCWEAKDEDTTPD